MNHVFSGSFLTFAVSTLLAKGSIMKNEDPFRVELLDGYDAHAQSIVRGLGDENFQVTVPQNQNIDQFSFEAGKLNRTQIQLDEYRILTSYSLAPANDGFFLFMGSGVSYFNKDGSSQRWSDQLAEQFYQYRLDGDAHSLPDGNAVATFFYYAKKDIEEFRLLKFDASNASHEVLMSHPQKSVDGLLERIDLRDGFILTWSRPTESNPEPARYYGFDGKPSNHPLAGALNLLHRSKIDLRSPSLMPEYGALYPSKNANIWGLFPWKGIPGHPDRRLFLLSVTDTVQALPIVCGRHSLELSTSLDFVVVHPQLNLFLLGIKHGQHEPKTELYLGRVELKDKAYQAKTYRLRPFPGVSSPVFSRNGNVLVFASQTDQGVNAVFAELPDLIADVNRRYPEAKLDLEALKVEVK